MSQKFSLYPDLQVIENLEFFAGMYGIGGRRFARRAGELLQVMSLGEHRHVRTSDLPGGFRQRLALACSILHEPGSCSSTSPRPGWIRARGATSGGSCAPWRRGARPCW